MLVDFLDYALKYELGGMELGVRGGSLRSECRIEVYDRGPGIPAKDLPGIYNRLYRSNSLIKASGTGLGLPFC